MERAKRKMVLDHLVIQVGAVVLLGVVARLGRPVRVSVLQAKRKMVLDHLVIQVGAVVLE